MGRERDALASKTEPPDDDDDDDDDGTPIYGLDREDTPPPYIPVTSYWRVLGPLHPPDSPSYLKWKSMLLRGVSSFIAKHHNTFIRRLKRGVPQEFRWEVWKAAVDLPSFYRPGLYDRLHGDTNKYTSLITTDTPRTFPELKAFDDRCQRMLFRVLNAFANFSEKGMTITTQKAHQNASPRFRMAKSTALSTSFPHTSPSPAEATSAPPPLASVGYCQGMNFVAALLLLASNFNEEETFWIFVAFMELYDLQYFFRDKFPLLRKFLVAFNKVCELNIPELHRHMTKENLMPQIYLHQWFLTLFVNCLPLPCVLVLWDYLICEGLPVVIALAVALLKLLSHALITQRFEEMIKYLKTMKGIFQPRHTSTDDAEIGRLLVRHAEMVVFPDLLYDELLHFKPDEVVKEAEDEDQAALAAIMASRVLLPRFVTDRSPANQKEGARLPSSEPRLSTPKSASDFGEPSQISPSQRASYERKSEPPPGVQQDRLDRIFLPSAASPSQGIPVSDLATTDSSQPKYQSSVLRQWASIDQVSQDSRPDSCSSATADRQRQQLSQLATNFSNRPTSSGAASAPARETSQADLTFSYDSSQSPNVAQAARTIASDIWLGTVGAFSSWRGGNSAPQPP